MFSQRHASRFGSRQLTVLAAAVAFGLGSLGAAAQEEAQDEPIEEIVTVGSQIRGAKISGALPVSIVDQTTIEALGVASGDELLDLIPENGQNYFNEAANISGGVNSARGDVGAFNLRSLGTGNTLVLLNGRRMVNNAAYQTEEVGGSFVPVNTVNSNTIPVFGIQRLEVLREGATAIYGADAVAGVVNTVLKSDFEGFNIQVRYDDFANIPRNDQSLMLEWGKNFNEGRTNVGVFANYYTRDRVNAQDDPRWANSDFRSRIPAGSPWEGDTAFRNDSANSLYGQFDIVNAMNSGGVTDRYGLVAAGLVDTAGEFETYPVGEARCVYLLPTGICGGPDGQGTYRYNLNENRDISSALDRYNAFVYVNHEFESGLESFTEFGFYRAETNLLRHPSTFLGGVTLRVGAQNYYNPYGPVGSPNRLPDVVNGVTLAIPVGGLALDIDNYRFAELPRVVDNNADYFRIVQGFRGTLGEWDWESAVTWSKAEQEDITHNRVSNILMQEALNDPTPAAYNPFVGGVGSNIERALIDVRRDNETELKMFDLKFSNNELFNMPAGPVGLLAGYEIRKESFVDDRDPRLDGTIVYTHRDGTTYPFVSDVVNSSPTPDSAGNRTVNSLFTEMQIPLFENFDLQAALRYEDFDDIGESATVGKLAFGWRVIEPLLIRGSWSQGFRVPNLVTVNEGFVARSNTRTDWTCVYAAENGGDPGQDIVDCSNSTQRVAQGSVALDPEESTNYSIGVVFEPLENLTLTLDFWEIEKERTIGLFGEENHTILDLVYRLEQGDANCAALEPNAAVVRLSEATMSPEQIAVYQATGICPAALIDFVDDRYINLDTRTVRGYDIGIYYDWDTKFGEFGLRYVGSFLSKFEQTPGGDALVLLEAQESCLLPLSIPVFGFSDLIGQDGNQDDRQNLSIDWRRNDWAASVSGYRIGSFYQNDLTLDDGTLYVLPSMTTWNAKVDYSFDWGDTRLRTRFGINNLTDERAPLADDSFGYISDAHRDLGRSFYVDLRLSF